MTRNNFSGNLSYLCDSAASIAEVARELGINRQQFNKYRSGRHLPSRRNLAAIAQHFGIGIKDLFLPFQQFVDLYTRGASPFASLIEASSRFEEFTTSFVSTGQRLDDLLGVYLRYQASSIYEARILRSVMGFYEKDSVVRYFYIERFNALDGNRKKLFGFRYHGICNYLDGKLFLMDVEGDQQNECTFSILTPIARKPRRFMFGTMMGVAASTAREPFATRVALQKIGRLPLIPSHLRQASTLPLASTEIPTEVRAYLYPLQIDKPEMLRG